MSEDIHAAAREAYEQAARILWAKLDGWVNGYDATRPAWPLPPCSPLRDRIPRLSDGRRYQQQVDAARRAEDLDRRAWIEDVRCRLGLVAGGRSPHRVTVTSVPGGWPHGPGPWTWCWSCRFPGCFAGLGARYRTWDAAITDALAHPLDAHKAAIRAAVEAAVAPLKVTWLTDNDWTTGEPAA